MFLKKILIKKYFTTFMKIHHCGSTDWMLLLRTLVLGRPIYLFVSHRRHAFVQSFFMSIRMSVFLAVRPCVVCIISIISEILFSNGHKRETFGLSNMHLNAKRAEPRLHESRFRLTHTHIHICNSTKGHSTLTMTVHLYVSV